MASNTIVGAITAISLSFQLWVATTETFCGLFGQDSIVRGILTPIDSTSGLLLFFALLHYFECLEKFKFLKLSRWDLLHAPDDLKEASFLKFQIRTNWKQIEKSARIARTKWKGLGDQVRHLLIAS
jgi:hypothetical protein